MAMKKPSVAFGLTVAFVVGALYYAVGWALDAEVSLRDATLAGLLAAAIVLYFGRRRAVQKPPV